MEIKEEYEIVGEVAHKTQIEKNRDDNKRWIAFDDLIKEIDDMLESVELAGFDNPVDESYYNALLTVKDMIISNDSKPKDPTYNKNCGVKQK